MITTHHSMFPRDTCLVVPPGPVPPGLDGVRGVAERRVDERQQRGAADFFKERICFFIL